MLSRAKVVKSEKLGDVGAVTTTQKAAQLPPRVIRREVLEAKAQAQELLQAAETRVQELLSDAQQQAERVRGEARQQGYEQGLARAAADAIQLRQAELEAEQRALESTTQLARLLAERMLGRELELDPAAAGEMAKVALSEVRGARTVRLLVAPEAEQIVRKALMGADLDPMVVQVQAADGKRPGCFRLETDAGVMEADLPERLEQLAAALRENLRS